MASKVVMVPAVGHLKTQSKGHKILLGAQCAASLFAFLALLLPWIYVEVCGPTCAIASTSATTAGDGDSSLEIEAGKVCCMSLTFGPNTLNKESNPADHNNCDSYRDFGKDPCECPAAGGRRALDQNAADDRALSFSWELPSYSDIPSVEEATRIFSTHVHGLVERHRRLSGDLSPAAAPARQLQSGSYTARCHNMCRGDVKTWTRLTPSPSSDRLTASDCADLQAEYEADPSAFASTRCAGLSNEECWDCSGPDAGSYDSSGCDANPADPACAADSRQNIGVCPQNPSFSCLPDGVSADEDTSHHGSAEVCLNLQELGDCVQAADGCDASLLIDCTLTCAIELGPQSQSQKDEDHKNIQTVGAYIFLVGFIALSGAILASCFSCCCMCSGRCCGRCCHVLTLIYVVITAVAFLVAQAVMKKVTEDIKNDTGCEGEDCSFDAGTASGVSIANLAYFLTIVVQIALICNPVGKDSRPQAGVVVVQQQQPVAMPQQPVIVTAQPGMPVQGQVVHR